MATAWMVIISGSVGVRLDRFWLFIMEKRSPGAAFGRSFLDFFLIQSQRVKVKGVGQECPTHKARSGCADQSRFLRCAVAGAPAPVGMTEFIKTSDKGVWFTRAKKRMAPTVRGAPMFLISN